MNDNTIQITYIGGPTALLEVGGARLLTDPTLDPAGSAYTTAVYTLRKSLGPAIDAGSIGHIDAVLLSHDHHFDNLVGCGAPWAASDRPRAVGDDRDSGGEWSSAARHEHAGSSWTA